MTIVNEDEGAKRKKWRRTEAHGWALHDEKSRSGRRDPGVVQDLFRIRQNQDGPEAREQMSAGGKKAQRSGASKMLRRILLLEEGKVPAKAAKDWLVEGNKVQITREGHKRMRREFEEDGQMAKKGLWNMAKRRNMMERGVLTEEMGDNVRECLNHGGSGPVEQLVEERRGDGDRW